MDIESIKSLAWFLIWGGLFYMMMRYGCGAHMMGGHGHGGHAGHDSGGDAAASGKTKDPVCGMAVDPQQAGAATVHGGKTYYFCSTTCRDKFEQTPAKYAGASSQGGHHHV